MSHLFDHPDIAGGSIPWGMLVASPSGLTRRIFGDAISDLPAELDRRGHATVDSDPLTKTLAAGYQITAGEPFERAMVMGYALARLSPVADTVAYQLADRGDGNADVHALDSEGATLATWRITGGGGGIPSSVAKQ